jgi:hypothetical protein
MSCNTIEANELLLAFARLNEALVGEYFACKKNPKVKEVHHGFDIRECEAGSRIDCFLEAELDSGPSYCWWVEINFGADNWAISQSLSKTENGEQHLLKDLGNFHDKSLRDFFLKLKTAISITTASIHSFDFSELNCSQDQDP